MNFFLSCCFVTKIKRDQAFLRGGCVPQIRKYLSKKSLKRGRKVPPHSATFFCCQNFFLLKKHYFQQGLFYFSTFCSIFTLFCPFLAHEGDIFSGVKVVQRGEGVPPISATFLDKKFLGAGPLGIPLRKFGPTILNFFFGLGQSRPTAGKA